MLQYILMVCCLLGLGGTLFLPVGPSMAGDAGQTSSARRLNAQPINDRTADTDNRDTQNNPSLVDLGGGNLVATWNDSASWDGTSGGSNDHLMGYATSSDNGVTWTDRGTLADNAVGDFGGILANDTENGNVYLSATTFGFTHAALYRSTNNGRTFGAPRNVSPGYPVSGNFISAAILAVDNFPGSGRGNIYGCWNRFDVGASKREIRFTRSLNDGNTFTPNLGVLISGADGNGGAGCAVLVDPDHVVYVIYLRGTNPQGLGGDNKFYMRRSIDRGVSFEDEVEVADLLIPFSLGSITLGDIDGTITPFGTSAVPRAAVNPVDGRGYLYLIYNDDTAPGDGFNELDSFLTFSKNGGQTWSDPVRINDDVVGDQFHPSIAFAAGGEKLIVSYYSRSHDPGRRMFHRRARLATLNANGKPVFSQSFQLGADTPFMSSGPDADPHVLGSVMTFLGGSEGAAGGEDTLSVTWTENRQPLGIHPRQPDVRFAQVALPAPSSNVGLSLAAAPANIKIGKNTKITLTVTAAGGQARDVVLSFNRTEGLKQRSVDAPPGASCTDIEGFVTCFLGNINAGASKEVEVTLAGIYEGGTLVFEATVTSSGPDANQGNNTRSKEIVVTDDNARVVHRSNDEAGLTFTEKEAIAIPLEVAGAGTTVQVVAEVIVEHPDMDNVRIELEAPNGKRVLLTSDNGSISTGGYGNGNNCSGNTAVFNDLAATSINDEEGAFLGTYRPQTPLSDAFLQPAAGEWTLHVADTFPGDDDVGLVECFELHVTRAP